MSVVSQLGPLLFWIYIFIMFFVLMSMLFALISEAYETVHEESAKKVYLPRGSSRSGYGNWVNVWALSTFSTLISEPQHEIGHSQY